MVITTSETQVVKSRNLFLVIQLVSGGAITKIHRFLTSKSMQSGVNMNSTIK